MKTQINRWILAALMAIAGLLVGGCVPPTSTNPDNTGQYAVPQSLPAGYEGCTANFIHGPGAQQYQGYVVQCSGNQTTIETHKTGKTNVTTVTINGVTYAPVAASGADQ
jgi:hypothetical protein